MPLPNHKLGVHWIPYHGRNTDMDYIQALKPSAIKLVDPDPERVRQCLEWVDPNGVVVLRDWALSEQKDDMYRDPAGTGKRHAEDWYQKLTTGRFAGFDRRRIAICGINEPFVRNDQEIKATVDYTTALLKRSTELGVRVLALNLSVGWPMNHDTAQVHDTPPDWGPFMPLEQLIIDNWGFLCVHEYFYADEAEGVHDDPVVGRFGWYTHRIDMCPMRKVPIIIGEFGMEKKVDIARWNNDGNPPVGWIGNLTAEQFAAQIWRYCDTANPNIFSVMPFTSDFNHDWYAMDVQGAYPAILAQKHSAKWPNPYPTGASVPPPNPSTDPTLIWVPKYTGNITGFYGQDYGYPHEGMDISAPVGTPIYAAYDGTVAWSDYEPATYGNYVRTYHPQLGVCFFYGHMSQRLVQTGNSVKRGQLLGYSGNTGNSSGPHIHFEVRAMNSDGSYKVPKAGQPLYRQNGRVDPLGFITGWCGAGNRVEEH